MRLIFGIRIPLALYNTDTEAILGEVADPSKANTITGNTMLNPGFKEIIRSLNESGFREP